MDGARRRLVVVLVGLLGAAAGCSPDRAPTSTAEEPAEHEVVVTTRLEGPRAYYFEGALVHARLEPVGSAERVGVEAWGPGRVGEQGRWTGVTEGAWRVVGSTRVCNGNCGALTGPVDTCTLDLDVTSDTTIEVVYRWGEPCRVEVS